MNPIPLLALLLFLTSCSMSPCPPEQRAVADICAAAAASYCARCRACGTCGDECEATVSCKVPDGLMCDTDDALIECLETLVDPDCETPLDCAFLER